MSKLTTEHIQKIINEYIGDELQKLEDDMTTGGLRYHDKVNERENYPEGSAALCSLLIQQCEYSEASPITDSRLKKQSISV